MLSYSDFVSDLAHVEGKRTLLATSGDGTLSAIDLRTQKVRPHVTSTPGRSCSLPPRILLDAHPGAHSRIG